MNKNEKPKNITLEDARIIYRNFEGRKGSYNASGVRSFCVLLDEDTAKMLHKDGWNVRFPKPKEDSEREDLPFLNVTVSYKLRAPQITLISETTGKQTRINEDSVHLLDWADIRSVDLIINPSVWVRPTGSGIKAYLHKMYVIVEEDALDLKYAERAEKASMEEEELDD